MKAKALFLVPLSAALVASSQALTIDTVTVGDSGNPNDSTGFGGVSYSYAIGKYEVTLNQYTEFLNAVADTDTYSLYNTSMGSDSLIMGITRSGVSGSYSYAVSGDGNRPVTYVSWFDAARFTNWLHNGQPIGLQVAGTTEQGAYTLNGATSGTGFAKNGLAQYWVPSENEWYKAAYYQPAAAGGDADGYWLYPMQTNSVPYSDQPPGATPDNTRAGNFYKDDSVANGYDDGWAVYTGGNWLTPVGAYTASDSYYGTFDQGGNVWEWNDAVPTESIRGTRGGSSNQIELALRATYSSSGSSTLEGSHVGFRVATVPEPTVVVSLLVTGAWLLTRRKRPATV